ncbi:radical SAM protein, partial [Candidatus Woesearchaeota archaeon]|nr:radical SAM protein [Candidatus Woesearchaeota archaeon]
IVKNISINTNGTLLTKELVDALVCAGLTRFNLSLNAIEKKLASRIAGASDENGYDVEHVMQMARYIRQKGLDLVIAPIYLQGINEQEIGRIIEFAKEIGAFVGIQNFLSYAGGRKPAKELDFIEFEDRLKELEKRHKIKLLDPDTGIKIEKQKTLAKPFRKGQAVVVEARYPGIGVSDGRLISVPNFDKKRFKVKLVRDKHNVFAGV